MGVVFYPEELTMDEMNMFCVNAMQVEDYMNAKYGDNAPLFCDCEKLFKLPPTENVVTLTKEDLV